MTLKHGHNTKSHGPTPEHRCWTHMLTRCENAKSPAFKWYGGRGVKVCERWHEFANFLADMGPRPAGMSLDRYPDQNGNYEPGNCRWATMQQQQRNRRNNRLFIVGGVEACLAEHCERVGVRHTTVLKRLKKGAPIEVALSAKRLRRGLFEAPQAELLAKLKAELGVFDSAEYRP